MLCEWCSKQLTKRQIQNKGRFCCISCSSKWRESLDTRTVEERFWEKVNKNTKSGCWEWTAGTKHGYGAFWFNNRMADAHRLSWEIHFGEIPDGLHVCHHCDNRKCINPSHLFVGTNHDNILDRLKKERGIKLNGDQVRKIRRLYKNGDFNQYELADMFGVTQAHISQIISRKQWTQIKKL